MSEKKDEIVEIPMIEEIVKEEPIKEESVAIVDANTIVETLISEDVQKTTKPTTLTEILVLLLANENESREKSIKLNKDMIDILKIIMANTPKIFDEIEENMRNIVNDGVINSKDIPDIMMLMSNVYELVNNIKHMKMSKQGIADICATIIKILFHILIEEGIIKVNEENQILILEQLDRLVDTSMKLIMVSYKANCCSLWNLFKCSKNKK